MFFNAIFEWLFFKNQILKVDLVIKNIFYILSIFLLFGCQENIQRKIVRYIEKNCDKTDTCLIKINNIKISNGIKCTYLMKA